MSAVHTALGIQGSGDARAERRTGPAFGQPDRPRQLC
jgi:hypothetical protein